MHFDYKSSALADVPLWQNLTSQYHFAVEAAYRFHTLFIAQMDKYTLVHFLILSVSLCMHTYTHTILTFSGNEMAFSSALYYMTRCQWIWKALILEWWGVFSLLLSVYQSWQLIKYFVPVCFGIQFRHCRHLVLCTFLQFPKLDCVSSSLWGKVYIPVSFIHVNVRIFV